MQNKECGLTLVELIVVTAILGIMITMTTVLGTASRGASLAAATSELRSVFHSVRMIAVARSCNVGLKFDQSDGVWTWAVYEDGDADGIRNDDIERGRDRLIQRPRRFEHRPSIIGVPKASVPDPLAPGKALGDRSPVRFGNSTICSFSQNGEATNGSVVLTDGDNAVIVQVSGSAARIGVLRWNGKGWTKSS
jgi:prepilin-type N-terminal cleavage/methylation domain-containing protein